jgi:hypothetical protein
MLGSVWVCVGILRPKIRSWMGGSVEAGHLQKAMIAHERGSK